MAGAGDGAEAAFSPLMPAAARKIARLYRPAEKSRSTGWASAVPTLRRLAAGLLIFAAGALAGAYGPDLVAPPPESADASEALLGRHNRHF